MYMWLCNVHLDIYMWLYYVHVQAKILEFVKGGLYLNTLYIGRGCAFLF